MQIKSMPIGEIQPAQYNPRTDLKPGDPEYEHIKASIEKWDLVEPLVWNERSGNLVGGHQRLKILTELGHKDVQVSVVDLDPQDEAALNLALNKVKGAWDDHTLASLLSELVESDYDLTPTGFSESDLDELLDSTRDPSDVEEDEPPPVPETPKSKRGEIYELGPHRLMCGDSTNADDVAKLMGGKKADMVFTDPPYGVGYQDNESLESLAKRNRRQDGKTVANDSLEGVEFGEFLDSTFATFPLCPGGVFYLCAPPGHTETDFRVALGRSKDLMLKQCIVWVKDRFVFGRQDYHWRHESILYGWREGAAHHFTSDKTQSTVWEIPRPGRSPEHPTMKPILLVATALNNSSKRGQLVYDPFLGSGTTIMAADGAGRICYGLELDPAYCDVIRQRYANIVNDQSFAP